MDDIQAVYITNKEGKAIFAIEYFEMGSSDEDQMLLSNFLSAFQSFSSELDESSDKIKILELTNSIIVFTEYKEAGIKFIIKGSLDAKMNKVRNLLKQIENLFLNDYLGHYITPEELEGEKMKHFHQAILELVEKGEKQRNVENFLDNL